MANLKEILDTYSRAAGRIEFALDRLSESKVKWKPNPKKWSIREILCHLADSEIVFVARMQVIIASDAKTPPVLAAYDQDTLAERHSYNALDEQTAFQTFKYLRRYFSLQLKALPETAFEKFGMHEVRGKQTLRDILEYAVSHGETHLRQIEALKEQLQEQER